MPEETSNEVVSTLSDPVRGNLAIKEDSEFVLASGTEHLFERVGPLGHGLMAVVDKVRSTNGEVFAKKSIYYSSARERRDKEVFFNNEVGILKILKGHSHIIRLYASFTAKRELCLLLQPAADQGNLKQYLEDFRESFKDSGPTDPVVIAMEQGLERAFGCLANGLAYMHARGIRHRDIKPGNILIHQNMVIFTDFGSSRDVGGSGLHTTEGTVDFQTPKYSAPEVINRDKRSFEADIFSLGCVYLEILSAISRAFRLDQGKRFHEIMDNIHRDVVSAVVPEKFSFLRSMIFSMTSRHQEERPKAGNVFKHIAQHPGFCCDQCHLGPQQKRKGSYSGWQWDDTQNLFYCYILNQEGYPVGYTWHGIDASRAPEHVFYSAAGPSEPDAVRNLYPPVMAQNPKQLLSTPQIPPSIIVSGDDPEVLEFKYRRVKVSSYAEFFKPGRVFKMLWTESQAERQVGSGVSKASSYVSHEANEQGDFNEIRKYVVISNEGLVSRCMWVQVPIEPCRRRRGSSSTMFTPKEMGIIYTSQVAPAPFPEEDFSKTPIQVIAINGQSLETTSRLNYKKQKSVEHNGKVIDIGEVAEHHMHMLLGYYEEAMRNR